MSDSWTDPTSAGYQPPPQPAAPPQQPAAQQPAYSPQQAFNPFASQQVPIPGPMASGGLPSDQPGMLGVSPSMWQNIGNLGAGMIAGANARTSDGHLANGTGFAGGFGAGVSAFNNSVNNQAQMRSQIGAQQAATLNNQIDAYGKAATLPLSIAQAQARLRAWNDPNFLGGGSNPYAPTQPPSGGAPGVAAPGGGAPGAASWEGYVLNREGTGSNPTPGSTSKGFGGFTDPAWNDYVAAHPATFANMTPQQISDFRTQPGNIPIMADAIDSLARKNIPVLSAAGAPVNGTTLAMAHHLGPAAAAAVYSAAPGTPMEKALGTVLSSDQVASYLKGNPDLRNTTTDAFTRLYAAAPNPSFLPQQGGGGGGQQQPGAGGGQQSVQAGAQPQGGGGAGVVAQAPFAQSGGRVPGTLGQTFSGAQGAGQPGMPPGAGGAGGGGGQPVAFGGNGQPEASPQMGGGQLQGGQPQPQGGGQQPAAGAYQQQGMSSQEARARAWDASQRAVRMQMMGLDATPATNEANSWWKYADDRDSQQNQPAIAGQTQDIKNQSDLRYAGPIQAQKSANSNVDMRPGAMSRVFNPDGSSQWIKNPQLEQATGPNGETYYTHVSPPMPGSPPGTPGTASTVKDDNGNPVLKGLGPAQAGNLAIMPKVTQNFIEHDYKVVNDDLGQVLDNVTPAKQQLIQLRTLNDQNNVTGAAGELRAGVKNWVQTFLPGVASAADIDASPMQEIKKIALMGAGKAERSDQGARGGIRLLEMYVSANPGLDNTPKANHDMANALLISHQYHEDYAQGATGWVNGQYSAMQAAGSAGNYQPLTNYDKEFNAKYRPELYAAATSAMNGKPSTEWSKGLTRQQAQIVAGIIQRADPSSVIDMGGRQTGVSRITKIISPTDITPAMGAAGAP